jgi:hypothetical protein
MQRTRESLAETVGEIKETVEQEYQSVRKTVSGVLDYREQFKDEPLVWSLGALSAGFALATRSGTPTRIQKVVSIHSWRLSRAVWWTNYRLWARVL